MQLVNNKKVKCCKQITRLNRYHNCLIDNDIVEIQALNIWFDQIHEIVPTKLEFYDGKYRTYYTDLNIIKIVDDIKLNKTYDLDGTYLLYYDDPYVKNFRNLSKRTKNTKYLVGKYILDWKNNSKLISQLSASGSEYIELNYYIYF